VRSVRLPFDIGPDGKHGALIPTVLTDEAPQIAQAVRGQVQPERAFVKVEVDARRLGPRVAERCETWHGRPQGIERGQPPTRVPGAQLVLAHDQLRLNAGGEWRRCG